MRPHAFDFHSGKKLCIAHANFIAPFSRGSLRGTSTSLVISATRSDHETSIEGFFFRIRGDKRWYSVDRCFVQLVLVLRAPHELVGANVRSLRDGLIDSCVCCDHSKSWCDVKHDGSSCCVCRKSWCVPHTAITILPPTEKAETLCSRTNTGAVRCMGNCRNWCDARANAA